MTKEELLNIVYTEYESLFEKYRKEQNSPISLQTANGSINAFVIRCNNMYITNDMERNNDFLVVLRYNPDNVDKYAFKVTADPCTRRYNIANLCEQIYAGNIRNHRWIAGRIAICQDLYPVKVRRYQNSSRYYEETGFFGINIHDNGGFWNSSLGCVILESEDEYKESYKPLLKSAANKNYVPVAVIRDKEFKHLLSL